MARVFQNATTMFKALNHANHINLGNAAMCASIFSRCRKKPREITSSSWDLCIQHMKNVIQVNKDTIICCSDEEDRCNEEHEEGDINNTLEPSFSSGVMTVFPITAEIEKEDPFMIMRATRDDICEILDLMWDAYHPYEPTTNSIGLGRTRNCVFDEQAKQMLCQGLSVVARCKYNGCIVGAAINESSCPWDPEMTEDFACTLCCPKMVQLYMFWAHLQRAPELWEKYCQPHIFEIANLFVRECDRKKGVACRLMAASRDLGADAGYRVIRVDATNVLTARICEKLNMCKVFEIPFCSYVGEDNQPVFNVPEPDYAVQTYVDMPHAKKR